MLLMETDGHPAAVADEAGRMAEIAARARRPRSADRRQTEAEALALATARRSAFAALARQRPTTILEDVTVPRSELAVMVRFIAETAAAFNLQIGTFGHMGDGNLHPTFLTDERDNAEMERVHQAFDAIVNKALALGGTITGEHGVGLVKKLAEAAVRRRQLRADAADEARARPGQPAQPRKDLRPLTAHGWHHPAQLLDYSVLQQCMHCGMCLPTCPTYDATHHERNSPRGRISLMRTIADGGLAVTRGFADEMSYCLGCLACQTACPAGVDYAELFETARNDIERSTASITTSCER